MVGGEGVFVGGSRRVIFIARRHNLIVVEIMNRYHTWLFLVLFLRACGIGSSDATERSVAQAMFSAEWSDGGTDDESVVAQVLFQVEKSEKRWAGLIKGSDVSVLTRRRKAKAICDIQRAVDPRSYIFDSTITTEFR
jgi:hypothetical protein